MTTMIATLTNAALSASLRPAPAVRLSRAERSVARLVTEGFSNKQIASDLCVSVRTIESHVSHILTKLGARSRLQIAVAAMNGVI